VNSSTSISDPRSAEDRRRLLLFLGVLAGLLGMAAGFVAIADPYGRFHAEDAAAKLGGSKNLQLLSFIKLERLPVAETQRADVVILGDSRGEKLTHDRFVDLDGRTILNLAIGASTVEEMLSAYEWRARSRPRLRVVIITAPFERFAAAMLPNHCIEARPLAASALHYLLNWEILGQSWEIWPPQRRSRVASIGNAMIAPEASDPAAEANAQSPTPDSTVKSKWKRMFEEYDRQRADRRVEEVQRLVSSIHQSHARVVFWLPPLREDIRAFVTAAHLESERDRFVSKLRAIAPTVNLTAAEGLDGKKFTFTDPVHTADGMVILNLLLAEKSPPGNEGVSP
jgi:hypothetical protein